MGYCVLVVLCVLSFVQLSLQWADCGSGRGSLIHVSSLDINSARGNLTVHFEGSIESALHAAPKLNVTIEKNLNGPWSTVPCINKIGSCLYDGMCDFVKTFFNQNTCPKVLRGSGCSGLSIYDPIPYHLDSIVSFDLSKAAEGVKSRLTGTALRVQMEMLQGNKLVGCISMFITLELPCTGFGFGCK
ncbi:ganglioside GM2 activator-like [Mytilus galloprovincialis]|uniref:ganglioside GM2 activator-like n=1 Tax=Mytilus edulis TaxID=6550 RepID=UPI0039EEA3F5